MQACLDLACKELLSRHSSLLHPRSRPPAQLWDAIFKKREAFHEAASRLTAEEIKLAIPVRFPQTHVLNPKVFPGVSRFPVDDWEKAGKPVMTQSNWITFCMLIAKKDERLEDIFLLGKELSRL